ncbi:iron complex transport system permease protein [Isoptericola jiangsuensis]|uniref:Iron complex transport system permease protein n=1 Tax=Isoptericola jiangsuensis TaxID=548579 RepID=A0A2A9EZC8_9MICO|nr:iron ABC transporter permease [Isoptericola jiangsuensis]PFG43620.1 iron complex transport system permease protein [Isoptericola jiangsuensis]
MTAPTSSPRPATVDVADVRALRARRHRRLALVLGVLAAAILALATLALVIGPASLPPGKAVAALFGVGDAGDLFIVQRLRLPRILAALLAGAAFALAGALFQSTLRNPLASPDILGISGGASLGAVTCLLGFGLSGLGVAAGAFVGAATVALLIWFFAWRSGLHAIRFVLVGVGFSYLASSLLAFELASVDQRDAASALVWTVGSVADVRGAELWVLGGGLTVLALAVAATARWQSALALGDDHASGLGVRADRARVVTLALAVAIVAVATSVVGPLAFVALVAPAIARRLLDDGGPALGVAVGTGAALVLASDLVAQHGLFGVSAPTGIVTGLVGAPYLLWLLATHDRRTRS